MRRSVPRSGVPRMPVRGPTALRFAAICLLLFAGMGSALLAAPPLRAVATSSGTTTSTLAGSTIASTTTSTTAATTVAATTTTSGVSTAATTTSSAPTVLAITGHGWGHGLGMSQWGAYGYAAHGWTYEQILSHYYVGTTLGSASPATIRVLVAAGKGVKLEPAVQATLVDGAGTSASLVPGVVTKLTSAFTIGGQQLVSPLRVVSRQPVLVNGKAYRGRLVVSSNGKTLQVVDVVGLESYVRGVVPAEMPSNWPAEALEAQAVAARSYALANVQPAAPFDLYADTRSQAYGGLAVESLASTAAVEATAGQIVLYDGEVADTLYSSTSGGRTASSLDELGREVPYLISVPDPYDTASPVHDWGPVLVPGAELAKMLELSGDLQNIQVMPGDDGRAQEVTVTDAFGTQATVTGAQVRLDLNLRSTWFAAALLELEPPAKTMTYGGAASLTGFVRGAAGGPVSLEVKSVGAAGLGAANWTPGSVLQLDESGAFATIVRPQVTTQYRLAWGDVRAGLARIGVAPLVQATLAAGGVSGSVRPVVAGAPVQLQQQDAAVWQTVSSTVTDTAGAWTFGGTLAQGMYRVRCAPGNGLVPGFSQAFEVP